MTVAEWKAKVAAKGGIDRVFSTKLGLFMRINPMTKGGARNEDVTAFRHVLVEFDRDNEGKPIPKDEQYHAIVASGMPVAALIDSGNKSLHAWIRVDAPDEKEYRRRVEVIWSWFSGINLDRQNRNPSRLSRCPEGWRTVDGEVRRQRCWPSASVPKSWAAWEAAHAGSDLPRIVPGHAFMATPEAEPPQLVEGVLHQGAKMVLGGPSKARKSWSLIDLMLSVSTGTPWWGFTTRRGRSLYLNFELPAFALQYRITRIAAAKGIDDFTGFDLWNLRGHATDFSALIPKILGRIRDTGYALILIDPIYKGLGARNENDAGDIASLLNEVEQLAAKSGAAVVFGAHFSKGNQAGKDSIDRIGGSGVFARDPDVILTMTPHEDDEAHVIDLTLRALPPVKPFVVRWNESLFVTDRAGRPGAAEGGPGSTEEREGQGDLQDGQRGRPLQQARRGHAAASQWQDRAGVRDHRIHPPAHRAGRGRMHHQGSRPRLPLLRGDEEERPDHFRPGNPPVEGASPWNLNPPFPDSLNPGFKSGLNRLNPSQSIRKRHLTVRHLTVILTDSINRIRARIGKPRFARSGSPFKAPAQSVFHRRKGGSK